MALGDACRSPVTVGTQGGTNMSYLPTSGLANIRSDNNDTANSLEGTTAAAVGLAEAIDKALASGVSGDIVSARNMRVTSSRGNNR